MDEVSINAQRLIAYQDCTGENEMSILDVAFNLAAETKRTPSAKLKQLAHSALQFVQISRPFHSKMKNWAKLPDELIKLKDDYDKANYDFLEVRFALEQADDIQELLFAISARNAEKESFTDDEISLLESISVYRDAYKAWVKRKGIKLPRFWFGEMEAGTVGDDGAGSQDDKKQALEDAGRDKPRSGKYNESDQFAIAFVKGNPERRNWDKRDVHNEFIKDECFKSVNFDEWWKNNPVFPPGKGGRPTGSKNR